MSKSHLRFALLGCGKIGNRHAALISEKAILAAVCDIIPDRANVLAAQYQANAYHRLEQLLETEKDLSGIAICTPNGLHAIHSIKSLQAGLHVLCEKPMALSVQDCEDMMQAATDAGRKLIVVKQNRFNPPVVALKKWLDDNRMGRIFSVHVNCFWNRDAAYYHDNWRGTLDMDGGVLFTQFSHFIDLLYWMFGEVKNCYSMVSNIAHKDIIEFEDTGSVMIEFVSGVMGSVNYTINSYKKNREGSLTVFAEKGNVKIGGAYLDRMEYQAIENCPVEQLENGNEANDYGRYTGSMNNHALVYDNLLDVLENGGTVTASAADGLKTVEIIKKIYNSAIRI